MVPRLHDAFLSPGNRKKKCVTLRIIEHGKPDRADKRIFCRFSLGLSFEKSLSQLNRLYRKTNRFTSQGGGHPTSASGRRFVVWIQFCRKGGATITCTCYIQPSLMISGCPFKLTWSAGNWTHFRTMHSWNGKCNAGIELLSLFVKGGNTDARSPIEVCKVRAQRIEDSRSRDENTDLEYAGVYSPGKTKWFAQGWCIMLDAGRAVLVILIHIGSYGPRKNRTVQCMDF